MGYSEETANYKLPLYLAEDRPSYLGDWNDTMNTIDKGMATNKNNIEINSTAVANMKSYVDNSVSQLNKTVTDKINNALTEVNGAVEQVTDDIATVEKEITTIKTGSFNNCEIIGDSWCRGYYANTEHPSQGVGVMTAQYLGIPSINVHDNSVSGSGFTTGAKTFAQQISSSTTAGTNTELVIVIGGINDAIEGADVVNGVNSCFTNIINKCPNAEIHFFPLPLPYGEGLPATKDIGGNYRLSALQAMTTAPIVSNSGRIHIHNGCYRWGEYFGENSSDGSAHLNQSGYNEMGKLCASLIRKGGDFWPTFEGVISGYSGNGEVKKDSVVETNGMIRVTLSIQCTEINTTGTTMVLPNFAKAHTNFFIGLGGAGNSIMSFNGTTMSLEFNQIEKGGWILIDHSWPAGF